MPKTKDVGADKVIAEFLSLGGPREFVNDGIGVSYMKKYSASIRLFNLLYPDAQNKLPVGESRIIDKMKLKRIGGVK